jgi:hypothetical protein
MNALLHPPGWPYPLAPAGHPGRHAFRLLVLLTNAAQDQFPGPALRVHELLRRCRPLLGRSGLRRLVGRGGSAHGVGGGGRRRCQQRASAWPLACGPTRTSRPSRSSACTRGCRRCHGCGYGRRGSARGGPHRRPLGLRVAAMPRRNSPRVPHPARGQDGRQDGGLSPDRSADQSAPAIGLPGEETAALRKISRSSRSSRFSRRSRRAPHAQPIATAAVSRSAWRTYWRTAVTVRSSSRAT